MTEDWRSEEWRKETNKTIVNNLVSDIENLLNGKAKYYTCSDLKTEHKKIVIVYDHKEKN
tara:strand:- start:20 stop:199 length:180 start_codon:yes stop_codon:yes gene_type:complete